MSNEEKTKESGTKKKTKKMDDANQQMSGGFSFGFGTGAKRTNWAIVTFPALIVLFVIIRLFFDYQEFSSELGVLFSVIRFLVWGFAIFFVLSPFVTFFEKLFSKLKFGKKLLSMLIVYSLFFGFLAIIFIWLLPLVVNNVLLITRVIPQYSEDATQIIIAIEGWLERLNISGLQEKMQETLLDLVDTITKSLGNISLYILGTSYGVLRGVLDFLIGIVISVYMLLEKEALARRIKKLMYSVFKLETADRVTKTAKKSGTIFRKFIIGKTVDSLIVGFVSFFVLLIIGAPVPLLLAVIMAVTNMIPTIGPIIGAIPCLLITVIISPIAALWVLFYILFVQAVDGMWLGPKILGDTLGLRPFYIVVAVLIGGGLFGLMGAFLGTPTLAVIKVLLEEYTDKKLKERKIIIT